MAEGTKIGQVRKFGKDVEKTRTIAFVFSDETRDSYNTVLLANNWDLDRFNKSGVAFYNHNSYSSNPDMLIGSAKAWIEDNKLVGEITFESEDVNPTAEKIFRKILAGTMKAVSVGFVPTSRGAWGKGDEACGEKNETYYYGRCELLEISVVNIPANKNALIRSAGVDPLENLEEEAKKELTERMVYRMANFKEAQSEPDNEKSSDTKVEVKDYESVLAQAKAALAF